MKLSTLERSALELRAIEQGALKRREVKDLPKTCRSEICLDEHSARKDCVLKLGKFEVCVTKLCTLELSSVQ